MHRETASNKSLAQAREALEGLCPILAEIDDIKIDIGSYSSSREFHALENIQRIIARTLGIAGEEGAGKSTLINAILGLQIVPTDANRPGTVAPIEISVDGSSTLAYFVERFDEQAIVRCADATEFNRYLLQRENRHNTLNVKRGRIRVVTPHLADGLRLIDLPGLEGVSKTIRDQAIEALAGVHGAIVVINDRNAAPGLRAAFHLRELGRDVDAIICNLRSSKLLDEAGRPLPDDVAATNISEIKIFILEELERLNFAVPAECVFAIHVPAMTELQPSATTVMSAPSHLDEIARFAAWFQEGFGYKGAGQRLMEAVEIAAEAVRCINKNVTESLDFVYGLQESRPSSLDQAAALIARRRHELRNGWRQALTHAGCDELAERAVNVMMQSAEDLKRCLGQLGSSCRSSLSSDNWDWDVNDRNRIASSLNSGTANLARNLEGKQGAALEEFACKCHQAALATIAAEDDALCFIDIQPELVQVERPLSRLWQDPYFAPEKKGFFDLEWLWSSYSIERLLQRILHVEIEVDTSRDGEICSKFSGQLEASHDDQAALLEVRLDQIEACLLNPRSDQLAQRVGDQENLSKKLRRAEELEALCRKALDSLSEADRKCIAKVQANREGLQRLHKERRLAAEKAAVEAVAPMVTLTEAAPEIAKPAASRRTKRSIWQRINRWLFPKPELP